MPERTSRRRCARALAVALVLPLLGGCGLFGGDDDEGEGVSVFEIKPGQCFEGQSEVKAQLSELTEVDCSQEHAQESYALVPYETGEDADTYPGDDALAKFANGACAGEYGKYVGVDYLDSELFYTYLLPSARSWEDDDRDVICFVTSAGEPLQGSAKGTKR
ncbi:septum formation family protein [Nocardioides sp. URHA0020]|uniref:septum formation family protein n=1 Tax=Nocardioides sp. URHA0020 TaxID=1380392 RepID=UPI00048AE6EA|nr:septum formation family protein [Nocardioides sp. URHA0020]